MEIKYTFFEEGDFLGVVAEGEISTLEEYGEYANKINEFNEENFSGKYRKFLVDSRNLVISIDEQDLYALVNNIVSTFINKLDVRIASLVKDNSTGKVIRNLADIFSATAFPNGVFEDEKKAREFLAN